MRKTVLILSAVGIGAGLLYALESNRGKRNKTENGSRDSTEENTREESSVLDGPALHNSNSEMRKPVASLARIENGGPSSVEKKIDDRGTDQSEASQILKKIRDTAFDSSDEKLALVLGRPTEEIEEWTSGAETIDGDVVMKARALALQRGLEVE
jgi:hypothetical protein